MQPIVPSRELIRRTIETEVAYTLSRMSVLARLDGNPVGIAHRKAGHGWALMARTCRCRASMRSSGWRRATRARSKLCCSGIATMT